MPSELTELEQLHVELKSEQLTSLYCSSKHFRSWIHAVDDKKLGGAWKTRL